MFAASLKMELREPTVMGVFCLQSCGCLFALKLLMMPSDDEHWFYCRQHKNGLKLIRAIWALETLILVAHNTLMETHTHHNVCHLFLIGLLGSLWWYGRCKREDIFHARTLGLKKDER